MNAAASNKLNWQETSNKRQSVVKLNSGLQKTSSGSGQVAGFESVISAHNRCAFTTAPHQLRAKMIRFTDERFPLMLRRSYREIRTRKGQPS